jgi:hypothetical protein
MSGIYHSDEKLTQWKVLGTGPEASGEEVLLEER